VDPLKVCLSEDGHLPLTRAHTECKLTTILSFMHFVNLIINQFGIIFAFIFAIMLLVMLFFVFAHEGNHPTAQRRP
jgi:hypothetical protein